MRITLIFFILLLTLSLNAEKVELVQPIDSLTTTKVLKEVIVNSRKRQALHIVAYVRDCSTLTSYDDTITLFREKLVDFMLPDKNSEKKFEGWKSPRILKTKSYYRFTNAAGLDSVSDMCNQHFSWSDWVGIIDNMDVPKRLHAIGNATDTIFGKYSPSEIWRRIGDRMALEVDVLAESRAQRWVPDFWLFFNDNVDFEKFKITYQFRDAYSKVFALDLTHISCSIESRGRGRSMFMFNRREEPFFVSTKADFYIIDKEFITLSEAKKWKKNDVPENEWNFALTTDAPPLSTDITRLMARVESIDHDSIRLDWKPNPLYVPVRRPPVPLHKRYFKFIKSIIGL